MEQILEKVMNFINENTMLLIIICIFLIVILVIYLIDNTIKSKRLEKEMLEQKETPEEPKVLENNIPEEKPEVVPTVTPEVTPEVTPAPVVEEVAEEVPTVAPVIEETVEEPKVEEVPVELPTYDSNIEELLNKDYSANNEIVNNMPVKPEEPAVKVKEEPKTKYTNDKKLSDIFGKKEEPVSKKIETTQDFSDELDRILKKLNDEEPKIDENVLDESSDYTNMF